jgi:hypothetical protein
MDVLALRTGDRSLGAAATSFKRERDRVAAAAAAFARFAPAFEGESEGDRDGDMESCDACDFLVLFLDSIGRSSSSSVAFVRERADACDLPASDDGFGVTYSSMSTTLPGAWPVRH